MARTRYQAELGPIKWKNLPVAALRAVLRWLQPGAAVTLARPEETMAADDAQHPDAPRWFQDALAAPCEDRTVAVAGCPIHYLRWGDPAQPGVVLVHGGAAHAQWWSFLAPQLMRQYHVVALDLSGHGDSGRREEYPREVWADEALAIFDGRVPLGHIPAHGCRLVWQPRPPSD